MNNEKIFSNESECTIIETEMMVEGEIKTVLYDMKTQHVEILSK